jgi:hypothetical protein
VRFSFGAATHGANRPCQRQGGSNLKAKRKRLSIVFATLFAAKQGVWRAEHAQAKTDDYATGASCRQRTQSGAFFFWRRHDEKKFALAKNPSKKYSNFLQNTLQVDEKVL